VSDIPVRIELLGPFSFYRDVAPCRVVFTDRDDVEGEITREAWNSLRPEIAKVRWKPEAEGTEL